MPWSETTAMEQRVQFIRDWLSARLTIADLCALYDISRKTGYKWIERYVERGPDGLLERAHVTQIAHSKTSPEVEQAILALRLARPSWGPKKLRHILAQRQPKLVLPGRSTFAGTCLYIGWDEIQHQLLGEIQEITIAIEVVVVQVAVNENFILVGVSIKGCPFIKTWSVLAKLSPRLRRCERDIELVPTRRTPRIGLKYHAAISVRA
jgi:hypothetical protein